MLKLIAHITTFDLSLPIFRNLSDDTSVPYAPQVVPLKYKGWVLSSETSPITSLEHHVSKK